MRLHRENRRKHAEASLISLINIVFLILVFFMIMGRLTSTDILAVDPPAAANAKAANPGDISVLMDPEGRIAVNSERVEPGALQDVLSKYLSQYTAPRAAEIVLKADASTRFDQLDPVLEEIRALGIVQLSLATDGSR